MGVDGVVGGSRGRGSSGLGSVTLPSLASAGGKQNPNGRIHAKKSTDCVKLFFFFPMSFCIAFFFFFFFFSYCKTPQILNNKVS